MNTQMVPGEAKPLADLLATPKGNPRLACQDGVLEFWHSAWRHGAMYLLVAAGLIEMDVGQVRAPERGLVSSDANNVPDNR